MEHREKKARDAAIAEGRPNPQQQQQQQQQQPQSHVHASSSLSEPPRDSISGGSPAPPPSTGLRSPAHLRDPPGTASGSSPVHSSGKAALTSSSGASLIGTTTPGSHKPSSGPSSGSSGLKGGGSSGSGSNHGSKKGSGMSSKKAAEHLHGGGGGSSKHSVPEVRAKTHKPLSYLELDIGT